ncbi:uncharacterized protein LOC132704748 [Cylas formicarius]|uniref:uncharacterized protein LOC132704748 n=1 Tax=Cylas formicarius TaxID=197179 RepID=UPI0029589AF5|nr:uncharacterized protein LOC132704748 [Cylas formicarius]
MIPENIHLFLVFSFFCGLGHSDNSSENYTTLSPDRSYCFEYTWFGPDYNNVTGYNGTCGDYLDDTRAGEHIPCIPPIVISNDSTLPDVDYLWANHRSSVLCIRSESQACVMYTYYYNGKINNQTHMCAKVQQEGKGSISSGCFTQLDRGYEIELCVCQSTPGLHKPCNKASYFDLYFSLLLASFAASGLNWILSYR